MHITAVLLPGLAATICILCRVPLGVSEVKAVWFLFQVLQLCLIINLINNLKDLV